jgi:hypothetical protein
VRLLTDTYKSQQTQAIDQALGSMGNANPQGPNQQAQEDFLFSQPGFSSLRWNMQQFQRSDECCHFLN